MPSILRRQPKKAIEPKTETEETKPEPARKRASSAGRTRTRSRSRTSAAASKEKAPPSAEASSAPSAAPSSRTRRSSRAPASREAKAAPRGGENGRAAAAPAAAEPTEADLMAVLERQNTLLESLIGVQERSNTLLTDMASRKGTGGAAGAITPTELTVGLRPRLAIFVDVPNILYASERSGIDLDWGKIADFLSQGRTLVRAMAYAPISDDPNARMENERFVVPFVDHGYRIVTKPLKRFSGGGVKANFDVELALDILTLADRLDVVALVSGDGDFRRLVEIVASRGVRVEVVAFGQSTANDLRAVADRYIDIAAYVPEFSTTKK